MQQEQEGVLVDPNMEYGEEFGDYEGYEDGNYEASMMDNSGHDGNKELDEMIFQNMTMSTNETGRAVWTCNVCGKTGGKWFIQHHVETHLQGVELKCLYCDKKPKTKEALRVHIIRYHKNQ